MYLIFDKKNLKIYLYFIIIFLTMKMSKIIHFKLDYATNTLQM